MENQLMPVTKLTAKQELFCKEYVKDFNATAAAIRSGYSAKTAYNIGWENVRKRELKPIIAKFVKERIMQPDEIQKRFTDIARASLNDFIIARQVTHVPKLKVGLNELIERIRLEIDFEDDYCIQANLQKKELERHEKGQEQRRRQIIRYKLELQNNPEASRIIDGIPELIEVPEIDIIKLSRDKEAGNIKSFKMTKDGPQVELYGADSALSNLARINAMFIYKQQIDITTKMEGMSEDQLIMLTDLLINLDGKPQQVIDNAINLMLTKIEEDGTASYQ